MNASAYGFLSFLVCLLFMFVVYVYQKKDRVCAQKARMSCNSSLFVSFVFEISLLFFIAIIIIRDRISPDIFGEIGISWRIWIREFL